MEDGQDKADSNPKARKLSPTDHIREQYRLDPLDMKLVEVMFEHPAMSQKNAAALIGTTTEQVKRRLHKPAVRKRLDELRSTASDLIRRAQILSTRRLMQLVASKDEYIALQAVKLALTPLLNVQTVNVDASQRMVYEVQIGNQGQVFQTMKPLADPTQNPQGFPGTMDLVVEAGLLDKKEP